MLKVKHRNKKEEDYVFPKVAKHFYTNTRFIKMKRQETSLKMNSIIIICYYYFFLLLFIQKPGEAV